MKTRRLIVCIFMLVFVFVFSIAASALSSYTSETELVNYYGVDIPIELLMSPASSFNRSFLSPQLMSLYNNRSSIYTTEGYLIPTSIQPGFEFGEIYEIDQMMLDYPLARELAEPSTEYNCHFYAWYSQDLNDALYWVNEIDPFTDDRHCDRILADEVQIGDIVTYWLGPEEGSDDVVSRICLHSAYVSEIEYNGNIVCVSKWGRMGLYEHDWDYVPDEYLNLMNGNIVDVQYYRYVQGEHDYYVDSITQDGYLGLKCSSCLSTMFCVHNVQFVPINAYYHNITCSICEFDLVQVHSAGLPTATMSMTYHDITCPDCGYTYTESHQWIYKGSTYMCTICRKTSSQRPPNIREWIEGEETVAALPPVNDKEEYTE